MKFYNKNIVDNVRCARKNGKSINALHREFEISAPTISRWVRDIPCNERTFLAARNKEKTHKDFFKHVIDDLKVSKNIAKILLSLLYWCEGSKPPAENCIAFSNSDWHLIKTFIELLRYGFKIKEEKIRIRLQIHTTHNYEQISLFWSKLLSVPLDQFTKPTITMPTLNMKRRDYRGTCTVKYCDIKLLFGIIGLYETFASNTERWPSG